MSEQIKKSLEYRQQKGIDITRRHDPGMLRAAEWQQNSMPRETFKIGNFQIAGRTKPAEILNGDFFNYFPISRRGKIGIVVGDINGHGVEPAMFQLLMQQLFKDKAKLASSHQETMFLVEEALNAKDEERRMGVTAVWLELDMSGEVNMVRNGHTEPLLIDSRGNSRNVKAGIGTVLNTGFFNQMYEETSPYSEWLNIDVNTRNIVGGNSLLIYTDGLTDTLDINGKRLGKRKVRRAIKNFVNFKGGNYSADEMCEMLMELAKQHKGGVRQFDDITVVVMRNVGNR
jgi:phosphoserine phosphatase RsbU/P